MADANTKSAAPPEWDERRFYFVFMFSPFLVSILLICEGIVSPGINIEFWPEPAWRFIKLANMGLMFGPIYLFIPYAVIIGLSRIYFYYQSLKIIRIWGAFVPIPFMALAALQEYFLWGQFSEATWYAPIFAYVYVLLGFALGWWRKRRFLSRHPVA